MGPDVIRNKDCDGEVSGNVPHLTNQHTDTQTVKRYLNLPFFF